MIIVSPESRRQADATDAALRGKEFLERAGASRFTLRRTKENKNPRPILETNLGFSS